MGVRLICEVLDTAPPDLGPSERLVLVIIAEDANDVTRRGWPSPELLTKRSGLSADGVQKVLRRLSDRGIELRVALGKDKHGHPVYAVPGKQRTFEIPNLRLVSPDHRPGRADNRPASRADNGPARPDEKAEQPGRASAPSPQDPLTPQRTSSSRRKRAARIPDNFAVTDEMVAWARERTPHVDGRHETEKFINYWRAKPGKDGTKADWPATWRNWMLRATERPAGRAKPSNDQKVAQALAVGEQLQAQYDRQELTA